MLNIFYGIEEFIWVVLQNVQCSRCVWLFSLLWYALKLCVHVYICVLVCECVHVFVYVCISVCMCTCVNVCVFGVCVSVCMYAWVYVCLSVCVCVLGYISNRQPVSWQFCSHQHTLLQHKEMRAQGLCRSFSVSTQPYIHTTTNSQECSARGFPALPWKVFDSCWRPHVALTLNKDFWLFWLNSHEEVVCPGQAQGQIQAA